MIKVSAPGKVHLIGEHSVVYGEPAIIAAIGRRCFVTAGKNNDVITKSRETGERVYSLSETTGFADSVQKMWNTCAETKDFSRLFELMKKDAMNPVKAAIGKTLISLGIDEGVALRIQSEVPIGAGMGSSSSLSVAIVKAVSELYNKDMTPEKISEIAFAIEQFNHGTPSGGDNSACCFGGLIWFQKNSPRNIIRSMKDEIPYPLENFILVHTGRPKKTTGELVQHVRSLPDVFRNPRIKALGNATIEMKEALMKRDFTKMKGLINAAQKNLAELGVSTPDIDTIAKAVVGIGGAAKLCGAGGGGTMLCWHKDKDKLVETIKELNYEPWETQLGTQGVRVED